MRWLGLTVAMVCGMRPAASSAPAEPGAARRTVAVEVRATGLTDAGGARAMVARGWVWPGEPALGATASGCHPEVARPRSASPVASLRVDAGQPLRLDWRDDQAAYGASAVLDGLDPSWRGVSVQAGGEVPLVLDDAVDFGPRPVVTAVEVVSGGLAVTWRAEEPHTAAALEVAWDGGRVVCPLAGGSGWLPADLLALPGARASLAVTRTAAHEVAGGTAVVVSAVREVPLREAAAPEVRRAGAAPSSAPVRKRRRARDSAPA